MPVSGGKKVAKAFMNIADHYDFKTNRYPEFYQQAHMEKNEQYG